MLYTVGYRGWTIWRDDPAKPFSISKTTATDRETLVRAREATGLRDFASARREVDYLK